MPSRRKSARGLKGPGSAKPLKPVKSIRLTDAFDWTYRISTAVLASMIVHTILVFGITFKAANPDLFRTDKPLDVVLVNAKSESKPLKADVLAQSNLDGGGDVEQEVHASSPLPADEADSVAASSDLDRRIKQQEAKVKQLMAMAQSKYAVDSSPPAEKPAEPPPTPGPKTDLLASSLEMARLQARINEQYSAYEKRPRRVYVGTRAQEYAYARYVEDWRLKIERIGNLNYPEAAKRNHIYGALVLTVTIKSDGSLEDVQVDRSSGSKVLDAAAIKIVQMSAPFAPFTPEMRKSVDILGITRVWNFTNSDLLTSSGR
jgi:protein TonB